MKITFFIDVKLTRVYFTAPILSIGSASLVAISTLTSKISKSLTL